MTKEDKKLISEYMGWKYYPSGDYYINPLSVNCWGIVVFDLNDAGLCVEEIQKRGELFAFLVWIDHNLPYKEWSNFTAWLFIADNFFGAMAAWLKEGKK